MVRFLLLSLLLSTNFAYSQKVSLITGRFDSGANGDMVYIESSEGYRDSSINTANGFQFKCKINVSDIYFIRCPKVSETFMFPVFVSPGSRIDVTFNKHLNKFKFSGDKLAQEQDSFYASLHSKYEIYNTLKAKNSEADSTLKNDIETAKYEYDNHHKDWVMKHLNSAFSAAIIFLYIHNGTEIDSSAAEYFRLLSEDSKINNYAAWILSTKFGSLNEKYSPIPIYSQAPNFKIFDTTGNSIQLADFKGKYVLVDFWASWCKPCRANNANLKRIYNTYQMQGLQVLSISIDDDKKLWKKAIMQDSMNWLQGSDMKVKSVNSVAYNYQVYGVPYYILIDPAQKIIFKSIGGDIQLTEMELKKIFKN